MREHGKRNHGEMGKWGNGEQKAQLSSGNSKDHFIRKEPTVKSPDEHEENSEEAYWLEEMLSEFGEEYRKLFGTSKSKIEPSPGKQPDRLFRKAKSREFETEHSYEGREDEKREEHKREVL